ncbi:FtsB family cell division protein [Clostridium akagii]|uniref:FtsB family cell division protein n=1 Tax=Clostridium akagii TaxID=91623 RepID=UPI00056904CE|nr:septum formation initiator family protein [Clostridium akagii]
MIKGAKIKFLIIGIFVINMCYVAVNQQITMNKIQAQIDSKATETKELKSSNQKLQDELKMARSDQYSEKLAREKLGLIKQGEITVINGSNNK